MNYFWATEEQRSILIVDGETRRLVIEGSDEFEAIDPVIVRPLNDALLPQVGGGVPVLDAVVTFSATLEQLKAEALVTLKRLHATLLRLLTGDYSDEERDTWAEQKAWALSYETDPDAAAHLAGMLTDNQRQALIDAGQNPAAVMAAKILGKAKAFADHTMTANRLRNEAVEAVEMAATVEQVTEAVAAFVAQSESALGGQG